MDDDEFIKDACEEIDAAMFSGDHFLKVVNREKLKFYIGRWVREMEVFAEINAEQREEEPC
jgi:ADP-dependent phosphofructokinase/glucokinase